MWAKVDDSLLNHPKIVHAAGIIGGRHAAGIALGAFTAGVLYSTGKLTDGFLSRHFIETWNYGDQKVAEALVSADLWHKVDGGYQIHDWLDWNPSAESVKTKRKADADRKKNRRGIH